jgi:pimeloyl-ACP methyl ester carboxylesterase
VRRRDRQLVSTPDGRTLCFAEWGDPSGHPVLLLHGTPGARYNRPSDEAMLRRLGARVITYDRPGYGWSSRNPGRSVVDCVSDVDALADHLDLDVFSLTGSSGGGPHVLAVAARRPGRVVRARCNVGIAPFDAAGLEFFDGMDPQNVREFGWAVEGEERLAVELSRQLEELAERLKADPTSFLGHEWQLDDHDRRVLADPALADQNVAVAAEVLRGDGWGWVDDSLAFVRHWGFDVADVQIPVRVTYGTRDVVVPPAHGAWLGSRLPRAEVLVDESGGHLLPSSSIEASIRWLVADVRR